MALTTSRNLRIEAGKQRRVQASRSGQALLQTGKRGFDPLDALESGEQDRLPRLLPVKCHRMAASAFAFFRGSVSIMAADLGQLAHSGITVQLCGDAHVQNLGSFAAPDGRLIFDFNDFDESIPGPWEWDVKRMAASLILAGLESDHKEPASAAAAWAFAKSYCASIQAFSRQPVLTAARHQIRREQHIKPVSAALQESERGTPAELLKKFTRRGADKRPLYRDVKPSFWRASPEEHAAAVQSLGLYRETLRPEALHLFNLFEPLDTGFKVVGTGSVGLRDYVVLLEGNGPSDPLFLQIKQETDSAYRPFLPLAVSAASLHNGQRAALGQRSIQPLSDPFLGWTTIGSHQFLVRQLNDHKGSIDLESLRGPGLESLAVVAGELLARGHARSGDACVIAGYLGSSDKVPVAIRDFAIAYADRAAADYRSFLEALQTGRFTASPTPTDQTSPIEKPRVRNAGRAS